MQVTQQSTGAKALHGQDSPLRQSFGQQPHSEPRKREAGNLDARSQGAASTVRVQINDNNRDFEAGGGQDDSWFSDPEPQYAPPQMLKSRPSDQRASGESEGSAELRSAGFQDDDYPLRVKTPHPAKDRPAFEGAPDKGEDDPGFFKPINLGAAGERTRYDRSRTESRFTPSSTDGRGLSEVAMPTMQKARTDEPADNHAGLTRRQTFGGTETSDPSSARGPQVQTLFNGQKEEWP